MNVERLTFNQLRHRFEELDAKTVLTEQEVHELDAIRLELLNRLRKELKRTEPCVLYYWPWTQRPDR